MHSSLSDLVFFKLLLKSCDLLCTYYYGQVIAVIVFSIWDYKMLREMRAL